MTGVAAIPGKDLPLEVVSKMVCSILFWFYSKSFTLFLDYRRVASVFFIYVNFPLVEFVGAVSVTVRKLFFGLFSCSFYYFLLCVTCFSFLFFFVSLDREIEDNIST